MPTNTDNGKLAKEEPFDKPSWAKLYAADSTKEWGAVPPNHPKPEEPNFSFPADTQWDDFLHRYYKPVADAGKDFLNIPVGQRVRWFRLFGFRWEGH
jgi:hypothetical protein